MEAIPWAILGELTPYALLMLAILLILTGKLVPISTYRAMERAKEHWRDTATKNTETIHVQAQTIEKQTMIGDTVEKVMSAIQTAGGGENH